MTIMNSPNAYPNIKNKGIRAQANMAAACGQKYICHDSVGYHMGSDIEYQGLHISVKAYHFTLMSGTLCKGKDTVDAIWEVYANTTHSNRFAYVINETAYIMNIAEFEQFVKLFCEIEVETSHSDRQHTGCVKVRARRCEGLMVKWFTTKM